MATQSNSEEAQALSNQAVTSVEAWLRIYEANRPMYKTTSQVIELTNDAYDALKKHITGNGLINTSPNTNTKAVKVAQVGEDVSHG